jgi:hypothetical protein
MIETVVAAADFVNAIPSLWEAIKVPGAILLMIVGLGSAGASLHRGIGTAAGKLVGSIALGALAVGGVGLMTSVKTTIDHHTGGLTTGQYGN